MGRIQPVACAVALSFIGIGATAHACENCENAALALDVVYTAEAWRNVAGGIAQENRFLDNLDVIVDIDGDRLFGVEGLRVFAYGLYNNGHSLSDPLVGSFQGVSNIETTEAARLYELWTQWDLGGLPGSVRFGLYDLNSEFDAIDTASLFINPSHGIGADFAQSGRNGPSIFPATSLAMRVETKRGPWQLRGAILDGVPGDPKHPDRTSIDLHTSDGWLLVGEVNYVHESGFRLGAGYWNYTAQFDDLVEVDARGAPVHRNDNGGAYFIAESPAFFSDAPGRGLRMFTRYGVAQDHVNAVRSYFGTGAVYSGWLAADDQIGVAVAIAELGSPYREAQHAAGQEFHKREYIWELSYRSVITDWLTVQPDVQYVRYPGMNMALDDAWVVGLRFETAYGFRR